MSDPDRCPSCKRHLLVEDLADEDRVGVGSVLALFLVLFLAARGIIGLWQDAGL